MKKRLIAFFITVMLLCVSVLPASADLDSNINLFLEKIESISSDEIESYIILLIPMFMVDSGIDNMIGYIENYSENSNDGSYVNAYIGKLLKYIDKQTAVNLLESVKCTDITARREFLTALRNKVPINLSEEGKNSINTLLENTYEKYPSLRSILKDGGYTVDVLANLLSCVIKINGQNPFYIYNSKINEFEAGTIDATLKTDINEVWKDYVITDEGLSKKDEVSEYISVFDLSKILELSVQKLNSFIDFENREKTALGLSETGAVKIYSGATSYGNGGIKDIEIDITISERETKTVTYDTGMKRPTMYKKDGENLIPVKYAIAENGKMIAKISESGKYIIKETSDKFTDCDGWAKDYIEMLSARGIINGKAEGIYMPDESITREEFVKLVIELLDIEPIYDISVFDDVADGTWYEGYVNAAYENSIVNGISKTEFGVGENIKRQDMAKIINTVLSVKNVTSEAVAENVFADYNQIADYAKEHILSIYSMGIISGDDNKKFNPDNFATRAEAAKMIYGMLVQIVKA